MYCIAANYQLSLPDVGFVNQALSPSLITKEQIPGVVYICNKFDLTEADDVTKIVTNRYGGQTFMMNKGLLIFQWQFQDLF